MAQFPVETGQLCHSGENRWCVNSGSHYEITVDGVSKTTATELRQLLAQIYHCGSQIAEDEWKPILSRPAFRFVELETWFDTYLPIYQKRLHNRIESDERDYLARPEEEQFKIKMEVVETLEVWPSRPLDLHWVLDAGSMTYRFVWRVLRQTFHESSYETKRHQQRLDIEPGGPISAWRMHAEDPSCPTCRSAAGLYPVDDPPVLPLHVGGCQTCVVASFDI